MPLQHYIPATFLANFSKSILTPRRDSLISVGDKRTGKTFTSAIAKVAAVQNLYTLFSFPPVISALHVDEVMGDYEGDLHTAIEALLNDRLSAFTWAKILVPFIAGFLVRGPDFDDRFSYRFSALKGFSVEEIEEATRRPFSDNVNLARVRERTSLLVPVMAAKWIILETNGNIPLIVNDLGYVGMMGGIFGGTPTDFGLAFPLGLGHLIAIVPQPKRRIAIEKRGGWLPLIERQKLILDNHRQFNILAGQYARRFIFGSDEDAVREYLIVEEKPPSDQIPEPTQMGFFYRRNESVIGGEYYSYLDKLAQPPKSRGAWVTVDLT
jgi:hypothetical protein